MGCTGIGEHCFCCSLTVLPGLAWVLLNYILQTFLKSFRFVGHLRQERYRGPDDAVGEPVALRVDFRAAVGAHLVTEEVGISHKI